MPKAFVHCRQSAIANLPETISPPPTRTSRPEFDQERLKNIHWRES